MSDPPASSSPTPPVSPPHESSSQSAQPSSPGGDVPPVFPTPVASPGNRVGAMICDGTVLFMLTGIALSLVGELFGDWGSIMDDPPHTVWAHHPEAAFSLTLVFALVVFLYCLPAMLPGRFNGRTPGHMMLSTRLVRLDGKSVGVSNMMLRYGLGFFLPLALIPFNPPVFATIAFAWFLSLAIFFSSSATNHDRDSAAPTDDQQTGYRSLQDIFSGLEVVYQAYAPLPGPDVYYPGKRLQFLNTTRSLAAACALAGLSILMSAGLLSWSAAPSQNKVTLLYAGAAFTGILATYVIRACFEARFVSAQSGPPPGMYPYPPGSMSYMLWDGSAWRPEQTFTYKSDSRGGKLSRWIVGLKFQSPIVQLFGFLLLALFVAFAYLFMNTGSP